MPMQSQAQRRLMYSAAAKKSGAGGVSQDVAKEFVAADHPGKLPEKVGEPTPRKSKMKRLYGRDN